VVPGAESKAGGFKLWVRWFQFVRPHLAVLCSCSQNVLECTREVSVLMRS
jgi:hypothetical protein